MKSKKKKKQEASRFLLYICVFRCIQNIVILLPVIVHRNLYYLEVRCTILSVRVSTTKVFSLQFPRPTRFPPHRPF